MLDYKKQFLCAICYDVIPLYQWTRHVNGSKHRKIEKQRREGKYLENVTKVCNVCGWRIKKPNYRHEYVQHFAGKKHMRMMSWLEATKLE